MKSRSPKLLIFLTIFIDLLGFGVIIPILSYIGEEYAAGPNKPILIGLMMSSFSLFQMIFAPFWGRLSDRVGRRPILLLSLFGSTVSYALFALADSYAVLLVSRVFAGICGANLTAAQAYIADVTDADQRTAGMGLVGMAFGLGFVFGPVIGAGAATFAASALPEWNAQTAPGLVAASLCLINLLWAARALPESLPPEKRGRGETPRRLATLNQMTRYLRHPLVGPLAGVFFLATFAFSGFEVSLSVYLKKTPGLELETRGVYAVFIYVGLVLAFMHGYVVRRAVKFVPEAVLVGVGAALQGIGLAIVPIAPNLFFVLTGLAVLGMGQGVCVPSLLALVSRAADPSEQGRVMGVTQSASSLARILGPMFAMGLVRALNDPAAMAEDSPIAADWRAPFFASGALMFAAVWMAFVTRARLLRRPIPGLRVEDAPEKSAPEELIGEGGEAR